MNYNVFFPLAAIAFVSLMIYLEFRAPRIIETKTPADFAMNYDELE